MSGSVAETAEGARTIDAHQLAARQTERIEDNVRESFYADVHAVAAHVWFPTWKAPSGRHRGDLGVEWVASHQRHVSIGAATTVTLYVVQINDPLDRIVSWLDELQIGQTSLARLVGVSSLRTIVR